MMRQNLRHLSKNTKRYFKPDKASCGRGAEVLSLLDNETCQNKFEALSKKDMICEEFIFQCKEISDICPTSVNSCRILTLRDGQTVSVIAATFKTSKGSSFVDNMHADGIGAAVDVKTGVVITEGRDYANNTFIYHPMTGMVIPGDTTSVLVCNFIFSKKGAFADARKCCSRLGRCLY